MDARPVEQEYVERWVRSLCRQEAEPVDMASDELPADKPPVSFRFAGSDSAAFLEDAVRSCRAAPGEGRAEHTLTWQHRDTGLACSLELTPFHDFGAVEWVVYFENQGATETPLIEEVRALDLTWATAGTPHLRRSLGTDERVNDFQIIDEPMATIRSHQWAAQLRGGDKGLSSVDWLPFFSIDANGKGIAVAVGWTGQWVAEVARTALDRVRVQAGLEHTRLKLLPGERIRGPRILLLYWEGDSARGSNLLRQLLIRHYVPHYDGEPLLAPACHGSWGGMPTADHLGLIELLRAQKLQYDYYWMDAGWYGVSPEPCANVFEGASWSRDVGDWRANPHRHPEGLRPVADAAHAAGMKFLLWVEPERARHGTPVTVEHPEWFLSASTAERKEGDVLLLNLGNLSARRWATDLVSDLITTNGIDGYRQDFNMAPLPYWRANDAPDRQGMTEIRHIEGLYAFWDELHARHPHLLIDNCASGGRRIDLETISRSVPLWRNDYNCFPQADPEAMQVHGAGLSQWVPLHATSPMNVEPGDTYRFRSALSPGTVLNLDEFNLRAIPDDYPWEWHRRMLAEFHRVRPFWYGDIYLLTTCSAAPDAWLAYQLHRVDINAGVVVAFRRAASPMVAAELPLHGLASDDTYVFEDADGGEAHQAAERVLAERGLPLTIAERRTSRLLFYRADT